MSSFYLVSLGCAKNLVDSEVIIGGLTGAGWQFVDEAEEARVLIVNTCGFIQSAVREAIDEILAMARYKEGDREKFLVVVGCLVQRYGQKLADELTEVDLFVGTEGQESFAGLLDELLVRGEAARRLVLPGRSLMSSASPRVLTTPSYRAWLKITEGCNNGCSYCMIPAIRGELRSRSLDDLVIEAQRLETLGVRELSLIAQDSTAYGRDLSPDVSLEALLRRLLSETGIPWLRLLYLYPTGISDDLLGIMADNSRVMPYLDLPMQHVSDRVLRAMNRRYDKRQLVALLDRIRGVLPHIALRTTFLVGFPGETIEDFSEIEEFLREQQLDHVGVFAYAREEGAPSAGLKPQVPAREKKRRVNRLLKLQAELSARRLERFVGKVEPVLIEGVSSESELLLQGRTRFQAPEVDGCVLINDGMANPGDIVPVLITEAMTYDLLGGILGEEEGRKGNAVP